MNNLLTKLGEGTNIYSNIYHELVTGQMAFRHCLPKACSTTGNRVVGCPSWGTGWGSSTTAIPSATHLVLWCCDVLWQASPVSRPADPVLWSGGSALTLCIMSRTVHRCPCGTVWELQWLPLLAGEHRHSTDCLA